MGLITTTHYKIHGRIGIIITVKSSWVGGNSHIFMPIYSVDGLAFTVAP